MGFFSKKPEPKKDNKAFAKIIGIETCPICNKKILQNWKNYHLVIDKPNNKIDTEIDLTPFFDNKTGVCLNCGIVSHGKLLYKSGNIEETTHFFNYMCYVLVIYVGNMLLFLRENSDRNEAVRKINEDFENTIKSYRENTEEKAKDIDIRFFINECIFTRNNKN